MKNLLPLLLLFVAAACQKDKALISPSPDISANLVVNISFDGSSYDSVSGLTGNIVNATLTADHHGNANKAMMFNRTDSSYIDFGDLAGASFTGNKFTISCWINVTDILEASAVMSKRAAGSGAEYSFDNHFNYSVMNLDNWISSGSTTVYGVDPLNASAPISPGTWQHIAFTANGGSLRVYLNGVLQSGIDAVHLGNSFADTDAHFLIGNGGGYYDNYFFNGAIDDIRIYNSALEKETIQYLAGL